MNGRKIIFLVLDGVGIGELPDAPSYGDQGANTLGNVARAMGGLALPNLQSLGLGRLVPAKGLDPRTPVVGCFGRMVERSKGKDSTTGHWEIAGLVTEKAFPTYPNGFPQSVIEAFVTATGCQGVLGNKAASGTEIIKELGDEHVRSRKPIVYTSADSVFQIAAHEDVIPLQALYEYCTVARERVMIGDHAVGRVIARPFKGTSGAYVRTSNRRDFSLPPPADTLLDLLSASGVRTVGIGKIDDLFAGRGLDKTVHTKSNREGVQAVLTEMREFPSGFVMANLVDFDTQFGHRQDPEGFAEALREFDAALPAVMEGLGPKDLLMITADHGNDPTDQSTDHSREYVPILCFSPEGNRDVDLGTRQTFADAGKTVAEFFNIENRLAGTSFLSMVMTTR